jgi:hypothetical protein
VLKSINPNLQPDDDPTGANGYPAAWTQFTITGADGIPASGSGRIAFRYYVTDGGPDGANSNYIGIDTVSITAGSVNGTASPNGGAGITPESVPQSQRGVK